MISVKDNVFKLTAGETSYWFRVSKFGHLEHLWFGAAIPEDTDVETLALKRSAIIGDSVMYDKSDDTYCLENLCLEWSDNGRGDFRTSPSELKLPDGSYTSDFVYESHEIVDGCVQMKTLPGAYDDKNEAQTLVVTLADKCFKLKLKLFYTVFPDCSVIARRAVLENGEEKSVIIRRLMSMSVDFPNKGYDLITLDGGWIKETHRHDRPVQYGIYVNSSTQGASGSRHNPGFMLASRTASEEQGEVFAFNLVYSGNHYSLCELSSHDLVRVQSGINPHCFEWELEKGASFETPQAVMAYSRRGFNGISDCFHPFVNEHIVRGEWKDKERPVLLNDWEAYFFKFTQGKLLRLARRSQKLGNELFVLDDGWFGERNNDKAGLGDYTVNKKKLSWGLSGFAKKINAMGMKFGLWLEPEMVNEDSELYRAHPEYAVAVPGRQPVLGRNQLVLDLCNPEVRDYIVRSVGEVLDSANIEYVKWDMNRKISDAFSECLKNNGEFFHRYIIGLYEILERVFKPRPHILFESCASGGSRFDLGMLCYSPQVWSSDDTDPIERLEIQKGLSYFYPLSTMGAHVSESPHQQTLRATPLSTRFNVASFGCLGYEMDLKFLNRVQRREVKSQIEFYKAHRRTLQYGRFCRIDYPKSNKYIWQCTAKDGEEAISGFFQTQSVASEGFDCLPLRSLDESAQYTVATHPQSVYIKVFGGLVKHLLPVSLNPDGFIIRTLNKYYCLTDCVESYTGCGRVLMSGVPLNNQYMGTGYNEHIRLLSDFGSNLYVTTKKKSNEEK